MPELELQIGALPVHVRTARLVAAALARRLELDPIVIDEIKLAVGEACSRAVGVNQTAATGDASDVVLLQLRDDNDILEISVLDCGESAPADVAETATADLRTATDAPEPDLADGLDESEEMRALDHRIGLALLAGLVDDMSVAARPGPTGTVVTMRWPIVTF